MVLRCHHFQNSEISATMAKFDSFYKCALKNLKSFLRSPHIARNGYSTKRHCITPMLSNTVMEGVGTTAMFMYLISFSQMKIRSCGVYRLQIISSVLVFKLLAL